MVFRTTQRVVLRLTARRNITLRVVMTETRNLSKINASIMIKNITLFFCCLYVSIAGVAQERSICGTSSEALQMIQQRLIANKERLKATKNHSASRSQEDIFIPLKFHLVARNNGFGRASGTDLLDQMCTLNETFLELGMQFYIKDGVNFVDNGVIYDSPTILGVENLMNNLRDDNAVNIFVVGNAQNPQREGVGRTLGYFDPRTDWVVIRESEIRNGGMTLLHEIGHFFGLPHPFNGWDFDPYSASKHGSPAPATAPGGVASELADGSNCETAGDMLCDTPADYLYFSQLNNQTCSYAEVMIDPQGDTLQPDPTLIMGYFLDNCMNRFTPMQVEMMKVDLERAERVSLQNPSFMPITVDLGDDPISDAAITPADEGVTSIAANNDEITLEWEAIEGATSYFVETTIDGFEAITVNEPRVNVPVEIGRVYRWRVKPFNDADFCVPFSSLWQFTVEVVSSVPTIGAVENWTIQPNPLHTTSDLIITLNANQQFEADILLRNLSGSTMTKIANQTFSTGSNTLQLSANGLEAGLYILSLENEEGVSQQKVVVY